jgi:hypothetical protein
MLKRRSRRLGVVTAVVALTSIAGGTAAYASASHISADATNTIAVHESGGINLSAFGGVRTPIVSVFLHHGQYVLSASGDLVSYGPSDYARCDLVVNGTEIASESTVVGDPTQPGNVGPSALLSTVTLTGGVFVHGPGGFATLQCWHDNTNGSRPYFDGGGSLWAQRTNSLSIQPF